MGVSVGCCNWTPPHSPHSPNSPNSPSPVNPTGSFRLAAPSVDLRHITFSVDKALNNMFKQARVIVLKVGALLFGLGSRGPTLGHRRKGDVSYRRRASVVLDYLTTEVRGVLERARHVKAAESSAWECSRRFYDARTTAASSRRGLHASSYSNCALGFLSRWRCRPSGSTKGATMRVRKANLAAS